MQRGLPCGQLRHGTRFPTCNPLETLTRHFFIKIGVDSERKEDRYNDKKNKYIPGMFGQTRNGGKVVVAGKKTGIESRCLKMRRITHPLHLLTQTFVLKIKVCSLEQHL